MIAAGTASRAAGRNDPCPCGSGKKFKHCCFGKPAAATLAPEGYSLPPPVAGTSAERTPAARQQAEASDKLHRRGVELLRAGRPVEAAIALRKAIETRADRAETHHVYGLALARAGHLDAATLSLRQAVALDPKLADAYQELGVVLDRQGRDLEAVQAYGQAAALSGKRSKTYRRIGELWQGRGQPGQAIAAYQRGAAVSRDASDTCSPPGRCCSKASSGKPSRSCAGPSRWTAATALRRATWRKSSSPKDSLRRASSTTSGRSPLIPGTSAPGSASPGQRSSPTRTGRALPRCSPPSRSPG